MAKRKKKKFAPQPLKYLELLKEDLKKEVPEERYRGSLSQGLREQLNERYDIRTTPICWGIPMDELLYTKFFSNFTQLMRMPWDSIIITESTYLPSARNEIHNAYLGQSTDQYLMMLDSDILPPPGMVSTLMGYNKHIVGGWYRLKSRTDAHPIVYDFLKETDESILFLHREEPGTGLEKVDGMGAGCWLMSRELAEALGESPYSMEKATEDLVICKKIMDLGYEMWVDWDMACAHVGVTWV
jgi:hypothetical protein